jgi:hypothetical protein
MKRFFFRICLTALVLFALLVISFIVWRVNLAHDVNAKLQAIRASGLPTSGAELNAYYPAVPDDENAALKMAGAFALMTNYNDRRSNDVAAIKFPARKDTLTPEQLELVAGYCAMNSNAIAQAMEAIKLSRCRYPVDLTCGARTLLPHLATLKRLSTLAEYQTLFETNASAADISTIIGMARTLDTEPCSISKLVRMAMLNMAKTALEHRLNTGELDEEELIHLSQWFAEEAKTNQMANALISERAMWIRYFRMSSAEIERDLRFFLQAMETNISLSATFPKDIVVISNVQEQLSQTSRQNRYIWSSMLLPVNGKSIIKEANNLAQVRSAQTAIAIERHRLAKRKLPENLNELVPQFLPAVPADPFGGQPLRYHRLEKGYVIYSVGSDGHDDGGREKPADWKSSDKTTYDITFTVER